MLSNVLVMKVSVRCWRAGGSRAASVRQRDWPFYVRSTREPLGRHWSAAVPSGAASSGKIEMGGVLLARLVIRRFK